MSAAATLASSIAALALMNDGLNAFQKAEFDAAADALAKAHGAAPASLAPTGEYSRLFAAEALLRMKDASSNEKGQALLATVYRSATRDDVRRRAHELWVGQKGDPLALLPKTNIETRYVNFRADAIAGALEKAEGFLGGEVLELVRFMNRALPAEIQDGESMLAAMAKEMGDVDCTVHDMDPALGVATVLLAENDHSQHVIFRVRVTDGEWKADRVVFLGDKEKSPLAQTPDAKRASPAAVAPIPASVLQPPATPEQARVIDAAIQRLAAKSPAERQSAKAELIKLGAVALSQLEAATVSDDPEISESAAEVIRAIRP